MLLCLLYKGSLQNKARETVWDLGKECWNMKKWMAFFFGVTCLLFLAGCAGENQDPATPTGYPAGSIEQPQIMYNGQLYFYFATGFDQPLPDGYEFSGRIAAVNNDNVPEADLQGARVEVGQEIYTQAANADTVYVKYKKGYAQFTRKDNHPANKEVLEFLDAKYHSAFRLWGPEGQDLYAFHLYPDHAEWECHILMPENTEDIAEYRKDLAWEVVDDTLIISSADSQEVFCIDIAAETATSATTGKVYQICEMQQPLE